MAVFQASVNLNGNCGEQKVFDYVDGVGVSAFLNACTHDSFTDAAQSTLMNQQIMAAKQPQQPTVLSSSIASSIDLSSSLMLLMEKQKQDADFYIRLQGEKLRMDINQLMLQHASAMVSLLERRTPTVQLNQKENELAMARSRTIQLQELLKMLEYEKGTWMNKANENKAKVINLTNMLENVQQSYFSSAKLKEEEEGESSSAIGCKDLPCKVCGKGEACMLLLPCRHLLSCKCCVDSLVACPLCGTTKRNSIEVLFQ